MKIRDAAMRDHRVATMVKYKGDKAKKEFAVENSVELNRIRDKYKDELTTEDNKHILPAFFGHLAREKGYYDPMHKAYVQHDTSMDYLQTIVRRFKTKNVIPEPTSRISDIFDYSLYRASNVNHKQVSHIMKYIKWYRVENDNLYMDIYNYNQQNELFDQDMTTYEKQQILQQKLVEYVSQYRLAYSTMLFIIKQIERKDYYRYRNVILPLLFGICRQSFIDAIIQSEDDIDILVEGGNDINLYDFDYKIIKKSSFLTKKRE